MQLWLREKDTEFGSCNPTCSCLREKDREFGLYSFEEFATMNGNDSITPIRDALTRLNCKFNLIGIVREFSFPRKSTGSGTCRSIRYLWSFFLAFKYKDYKFYYFLSFELSFFMGISDYYAILKIVDESYRDEELSVHIFTYKLEDLPQVMSYKDYIVLHQVKVFLEF